MSDPAAHLPDQEREVKSKVALPDIFTLRDEVERLRDNCVEADERRVRAGLGMSTNLNAYEDAYNIVLNLIDQHTRGLGRVREAGQ